MVSRRSATQTGVTMHISRTTVPGDGVVVHHMTTRQGERLCLIVDGGGDRHMFTYEKGDLDAPAREIVLESDEADQLAEVLHSRPIKDRLLSLERRVDELIGERGR
jgi:TrkA domain protein